MTLNQVTEILLRSVSGGQFVSDTKYDPLYIEALVHQVREQAIKISYNGDRYTAANRTISSDWQQEYQYTIVADEQDATKDYIEVTALPVIQINERTNGSVYCGSDDVANPFMQAQTTTEIAQWKALNVIGSGKNVGYLRNSGKIRLYGNKLIKSFVEDGIYQRPDLVTGYNYDTSTYPVNEGLMVIMKRLFQEAFKLEMAIPKDTVADTVPTTEMPILKNAQ